MNEIIEQTAGGERPDDFAPVFARLKDGVLFAEA